MAKVATNRERLIELFDADPRNDVAIAHYLGVSKQTISAWKNGTRSPKASTITKIAKYYDCSEEWLYGWDMPAPAWLSLSQTKEPVPTGENEQINEIITLLLQLPHEKRAEAVRYLRYLATTEETK